MSWAPQSVAAFLVSLAIIGFGARKLCSGQIDARRGKERLDLVPAKQQTDGAIETIRSVFGDRIVKEATYGMQPASPVIREGTLEDVLSKLLSWVTTGRTMISWIAGMAGSGKTSLAVTACRMLHHEPSVILGGSFFCSRSARSVARTEVRRILPTIAASLAAQAPEFATALAAELRIDDCIAYKPASDQIVALLKRPLTALASSYCPIVFVIDALDECNDEAEVAELLTAIAHFASDMTIKFILTSRTEMHSRYMPGLNINNSIITSFLVGPGHGTSLAGPPSNY